jgi:hypothetical protein
MLYRRWLGCVRGKFHDDDGGHEWCWWWWCGWQCLLMVINWWWWWWWNIEDDDPVRARNPGGDHSKKGNFKRSGQIEVAAVAVQVIQVIPPKHPRSSKISYPAQTSKLSANIQVIPSLQVITRSSKISSKISKYTGDYHNPWANPINQYYEWLQTPKIIPNIQGPPSNRAVFAVSCVVGVAVLDHLAAQICSTLPYHSTLNILRKDIYIYII